MRRPLFTTEDGVEVFEDDEYYEVLPDFNMFNDKARNAAPSGYLKFSTQQAAENYIVENKPGINLKEVKELHNELMEDLKDMKGEGQNGRFLEGYESCLRDLSIVIKDLQNKKFPAQSKLK